MVDDIKIDGQMALADIDQFLEDEFNELGEDHLDETEDDLGRTTAREDLLKKQLTEKEEEDLAFKKMIEDAK